MSDKTNNQPEVSFGLLPVSVRLELIGEARGATCGRTVGTDRRSAGG